MDKAIHQAVEEKFSLSEDDVTDSTQCVVKITHFEQALSLVSSSVSKQVFSSLSLHHFAKLEILSSLIEFESHFGGFAANKTLRGTIKKDSKKHYKEHRTNHHWIIFCPSLTLLIYKCLQNPIFPR